MAWAEPRNTGMRYRRLGNSGLHVSVLGLGGWLTFGGHVDNEKTIACMKQAYDCGINFFDTAESYADGQSEIAMGQAIEQLGWKRNDIVISTKLNWGGANGEVLINNHGLSRKHIVEGLRSSLKRLNLEYVDIVYAHRPDRLTPMEETVRAFNHVIERGWAFYWGTSEWSADEIAEACGIARELRLIPPVVEQPQYNLLARERVEGEYQRLYSRFGLGLTVFSPIKMGLLSGKYNDSPDQPPAGSRFAVSNDKFSNMVRESMYGNDEWKQSIAKVIKLKPIAEQLGVTQSQLALAWCLKNEHVSSVITGASNPQQIVENVQALKALDKMTPEVMESIDDVVGKIDLAPARQD
ncbi:voltage-gated potassium channel subunit beta [Penicillium diatomitis]|uniref:Voltage-gated potassium channel subunit beta n=1 Tax=Penicillium diatomitis TaxID=2819901 RepID=A0A9W9XIG8_9EURO|nr:voltage-gated potassium channel subunit beta [Penicillium diatomitis]KAJ5493514.1 voltage-gated potassium channel subunit beta [Penicillium diatomitis]